MKAEQERGVRLDRVTTGVDALDTVLNGGIPRGAVIFVSGLPGSGKTILSQQAMFANADRGTHTLYLTTLSEPSMKMLRFGSTLGYFRPHLLEQYVHFADLGSALLSAGPDAVVARLDELIREQRPEFIVIDSFKVMREYFADLPSFRAFASELLLVLGTWEITAMLVGEYGFEDIENEPEFAIADGIIHLSGTQERLRQKRYLNIVKMRGTQAFLGQHSFEITDAGIDVYPRMVPSVTTEYATPERRVGSAIGGITEMLGGGLMEGSVALISGGTGSGKTLTALGFAAEASCRGDRTLFVSFEESPSNIVRNAGLFGWDGQQKLEDGLLDIMHVSPSELDLDRHAVLIQKRAEELGAKLVVIDSVTAFEAAVEDVSKLHAYLWGIADHFKRTGVTLVITMERHSFFEPGNALERHISYVADTVIVLRLVEENSDVRRLVNVLKSRGTQHDSSIRELKIEPSGIYVKPAGAKDNVPA